MGGAGDLFSSVAEVVDHSSAGGVGGGGCNSVLSWQGWIGAELAVCRNRDESFVCGDVAAYQHSFAGSDLPVWEMGGLDSCGRAVAWAGRAEVVLAGDDVLLADCTDGMDAGFDSAKAA